MLAASWSIHQLPCSDGTVASGDHSNGVLHQSPCTPSAMPRLTALSTSGSRLDEKWLHVAPRHRIFGPDATVPTERHDRPAAALRCIQPRKTVGPRASMSSSALGRLVRQDKDLEVHGGVTAAELGEELDGAAQVR